ncbi:hypothetical protein RI367_001041 [Sorochytrium milnesiophthora]
MAALTMHLEAENATALPLAYPMNSSAVAYQLCDTANGSACQTDKASAACATLQSCIATHCASAAGKLGASELCAMANCATSFTQCYGGYCVPWLHLSLAIRHIRATFNQPLSMLPPALQEQAARYKSLTQSWSNITFGSGAAVGALATKYNITGGFCALAPPQGRCSSNDSIPAIPMRSADDSPRNLSLAYCSYGEVQFTGLPGQWCTGDAGCMSGKCFQGACDDFGVVTREVMYVLKMIGFVLAGLMPCLLWVRRLKQIAQRELQMRADEAELWLEEARRRRSERNRTVELTAEDDDEENRLPQYRTVPHEGEIRLQYTARASPVESTVPHVEASDHLQPPTEATL